MKKPIFLSLHIVTLTILLTVNSVSTANAVTFDSELYGKLNISRDYVETGDDGWVSNVSKLGIKGNYGISDSLSLIYQLEQEVDVAHGGKDVDTLFSTRNSFMGIKGSFGKIFWGAHDTPFKKAQGKVDLFNDQVGDIKSLLVGEVRAADSFGYHSPAFADGFSVQAMFVPSDSNFDASKSLALMYNKGDLKAAIGIDADMRKNNKTVTKTKVYDSVRGSIQYTPGKWKFGAIYQNSERQNQIGASSESGFILSTSYKHGSMNFMVQHGRSDIIAVDADSTLLGAQYHFNKKAKVYLYWWDFESGINVKEVVSIGAELKF